LDSCKDEFVERSDGFEAFAFGGSPFSEELPILSLFVVVELWSQQIDNQSRDAEIVV
jgi:hypothetical protein